MKAETTAAALPYYDESLKLEKEEVAQNPNNSVARMNLSFTYQDMGNALYELQTYQAALAGGRFEEAAGLFGGDLQILRNKSKNPLQRGFAAVALGIISEKVSIPWNATFSVDSNYRAKVDALSEILDIL